MAKLISKRKQELSITVESGKTFLTLGSKKWNGQYLEIKHAVTRKDAVLLIKNLSTLL